ncbi:hypothetical protein [Methylomicrobium lacus]|uniref:hypothetical protein n=1 Tax=Methylomicrobium lacus TaxID=136992 RepID=UPI0005642CCD|nr:hypothetical protein [Methylomicrobium lacus]
MIESLTLPKKDQRKVSLHQGQQAGKFHWMAVTLIAKQAPLAYEGNLTAVSFVVILPNLLNALKPSGQIVRQ